MRAFALIADWKYNSAMKLRWNLVMVWVALSAALIELQGASDPAVEGPFTAGSQTVSVPGMEGANLSTDVYYPRDPNGSIPATAAPCPVIVLGHGFAQSKAQHVNQGRHLATRGFITLIPNFNAGSDHSRNADELRKCIDWIVARNSDGASVFYQKVQTNRIGATGHSAGGLSAIVAASRDPRIRALAPMDPVDSGDLGVNALVNVKVPIAITYSEPSACNADGSAEILFAAASAPKRGMKIVGANHTDPQDPPGFLSILTCGSANSARQLLYRRYVTGWFEYYLRGDAAYLGWIFNFEGGPLATDLSAKRVTYSYFALPVPMDDWRLLYFGPAATNAAVAGELADPDLDELPNFVEYALNLDPWQRSADTGTRSLLISTNGAKHVALHFPCRQDAWDISYRVESTTNLLDWQTAAVYSGTNRFLNTNELTEVSREGAGWQQVVVRDLFPVGAVPERFLRLQITQP